MPATISYKDISIDTAEIIWDRDSLFIKFEDYWEKFVGLYAQLIAENTTSDWSNFNLVRTSVIKTLGINPENAECFETAPIKILPIDVFPIIVSNNLASLIKGKSPSEINNLTTKLLYSTFGELIKSIESCLITENINAMKDIKGVKHFLITNDSEKNNNIFLEKSNIKSIISKCATSQNLNSLDTLVKKQTLIITKNNYLKTRYNDIENINILIIDDIKNISYKVKEETSEMTIFTDGASRGNPGPGSIGVAIYKDSELVQEISERIGECTNNFAEYSALLKALEYSVNNGFQKIIVKSDSELVVKQVTGIYKIKDENIKELMKTVQSQIKQFKEFKILHIDREENKVADALANKALDNS